MLHKNQLVYSFKLELLSKLKKKIHHRITIEDHCNLSFRALAG